MFGIIRAVIIGGIVGYLAGNIMGFRADTGRTILLGVIGSFLGSALFSMLGFFSYGFIAEIIVGVVGACLFVWLVGKFSR